MRVALTCPYAWEDAGGVQVHVRQLAERLMVAGHEVLVVAPTRRPSSVSWLASSGRPVGLRYNASSAPIDPRPWSIRRVKRALSAFAPEVVHVHEPFSPSTSLWAVLSSDAPLVATFHSGATRSRAFDLAAPVLRRLAQRLAVRIAVSERAAAFAGARIGGDFEIVPPAVDVGRFADAEARDLGPGTRLLFVGRLDERKGFRVAVEAFRLLARERRDVRLVVAGDGPERDAVTRLPEAIRQRVDLLGRVDNRELPSIAAGSDVYLGASIGGESFGIVLVEAMAAGLPVVATDVDGYREVVRDGIDGLLVPPRDAAALAVAVGRVLDEPGLAGRLREAGPPRARTFDWSVTLGRLEALYRRAIERSEPSLR